MPDAFSFRSNFPMLKTTLPITLVCNHPTAQNDYVLINIRLRCGSCWAMTHPRCEQNLFSVHVSLFFVIVLTTAKLEKPVVDDHWWRKWFLSFWQQPCEGETMKPDSVSGNNYDLNTSKAKFTIRFKPWLHVWHFCMNRQKYAEHVAISIFCSKC